MTILSKMNLKTQAMIATAGILLLVLTFNTLTTIYVTTGKYRDALIARTTVLADGIKKDITKAIGFGLPLNALEGMGDKLRALTEEDKDISRALVMDSDGKVLYTSDKALENTVLSDPASKDALAAKEPKVQTYSDTTGGHIEKVIPITSLDNKQLGVFRIALNESAVNRQIRSLLFWSLLVALISFVVATTLVYLFVHSEITKPLTQMSTTAAGMAAGDLSHEILVKGETEIAVLGAAINTMSSNLREMLGKIKQTGLSLGDAMTLMGNATLKMSQGARVQQEATEQTAMTVSEMTASIKGVAENAEDMSQAATEASSSASEMASSIEEVARNAGVLSTAAEDTAASIEQMLASIKQVSDNTEALSASAEQTSSSITEMSASVKEVEQRALDAARLAEKVSADASDRGMAASREAIRGMQNIKEAVEATADVVNRLGKRSQEIGQILKVIDEVTDQTSLLALNAAILAAQAGEHGKGFAVVAEEIKELAERTAASTQEISGLIVAVREETEQSVQAMARGLKAVEAGSSLVNVTSEVLEQVADSSRQSVDMARAIEKTTAEQARGVAQIKEASVSIANQIEQIARAMQEQRRGSERIGQAAERMRDITRQVKTSTHEQTSGGRQIAKAVESVKVQAAQIASSTSEQSVGAQHISDAVSKIQKITQEVVDVSVEMDITVQTLKARADALQSELEGFKL
ncbi:MAG TPA: methyl-accepting chemotaxis protein [Nitrospirota bacterium]|nr:methyl-accepting chemotaxis protein [Nitrospirota bacterium]